MDDVKVRFQGFTPTEFTQNYFKEVMERIYEEAPASSHLKATVSKTREGFKAVVHINSLAGHFFATSHGPKITDVGHEVISKLHRQLDRWKTQRRSHDTWREVLHGTECG